MNIFSTLRDSLEYEVVLKAIDKHFSDASIEISTCFLEQTLTLLASALLAVCRDPSPAQPTMPTLEH